MGNLLLEAIFKTAKDNNFKLLFYLNPSYQGKDATTLQIADKIVTDSVATKDFT